VVYDLPFELPQGGLTDEGQTGLSGKGALMTRTAGPIWPPIVEQGQLFAWSDVAGETAAGRLYWPRGEVSEHS